jgi:hypothetical protein
MIHLVIILALAVAVVVLARRGLIQIDLSFPWLAALLILGFLSTQPAFVEWLAARLGILYAPIAVVFVTIFILFGLLTVLLMGFTRLRRRQIMLVRQIAAMELDAQEARRRG